MRIAGMRDAMSVGMANIATYTHAAAMDCRHETDSAHCGYTQSLMRDARRYYRDYEPTRSETDTIDFMIDSFARLQRQVQWAWNGRTSD